MEQMIKNYEKFISEAVKKNMSDSERAKLAEYHRDMVTNFQHERFIHMIIMFFFIAVTLAILGFTGASFYFLGFMPEMIPLYLLALIITILSFFYVKHYYFLENHTQGLYKYTKELRLGKEDK